MARPSPLTATACRSCSTARCCRSTISGKRLKIETAKGTITADQAIVTLPSAVIADKEFLFAPALPEKTEAARGLPLGLADKLFLSLDGAEEFEPDSRLFGRTDRTGTGTYQMRPFGRPLIEAYFGGTLARRARSRRRRGLLRFRPGRARAACSAAISPAG